MCVCVSVSVCVLYRFDSIAESISQKVEKWFEDATNFNKSLSTVSDINILQDRII